MCIPRHPPFKATLTDFRKAVLRKVHFCPRLAENKRKKIILDNMNSRICPGSSRYWLHKSDLITTKTAYDAISWNQWSALRTQNPLINLPGSNPCEKEHKTPYDKRKSQNLVQFGWITGSKSAFFYATILELHFSQLDWPKLRQSYLAHILRQLWNTPYLRHLPILSLFSPNFGPKLPKWPFLGKKCSFWPHNHDRRKFK